MDGPQTILKTIPPFERLSPEELTTIETASDVQTFNAGETIYFPGDPANSLLAVHSGRVKLFHVTHRGKEAILTFVEPGEVFGELCLLEPTERGEYAGTMRATTLIRIPAQAIHRLMEQCAEFTVAVTKLIARQRCRVERRLKSLLFRSNRKRLEALLLELAENYGQSGEEGLALGIRLTHSELASLIGSTRETVTVLLGEMQAEGLVKIGRRQMVITDMNRLSGTGESNG